MYRSRELSGVSIKTAGILEHKQPTEYACGKIMLVYLTAIPMFIV